MAASDNLCAGMAFIYSFFGITLLFAPKFCWGPDSALSYWTVMARSVHKTNRVVRDLVSSFERRRHMITCMIARTIRACGSAAPSASG